MASWMTRLYRLKNTEILKKIDTEIVNKIFRKLISSKQNSQKHSERFISKRVGFLSMK